ncbi:metal-dependent hydrolase [Bacillus alkalisoli]|uniref:metal-dependent hydrolase n=1 Tax=Bacillus alkalisoli TaxID=2011008 RepID=UPI000C2338FB|nr:metal-dependent hydrolase [Bacillus alkalisoli]
MDTSTHFAMGLGLGALAHLSPSVQQHPELATAIILSTVIGSNAPDFDYIFRLKSNGDYIRQHRGLSHSLFALPLWSLVISIFLFISFPSVPFFPIFFWTFVAVSLHVAFDVMNFYGTQVMRPFSKEWLSQNFIPLFDPVIFLLLLSGFFAFLIGARLGFSFLFAWVGIALHCIVRYILKRHYHSYLKDKNPFSTSITLMPTCYFLKWNFIMEEKDQFVLGTMHKKKKKLFVKLDKEDLSNPYIEKSKTDLNVQHFLASTQFAYPIVDESKKLVEWIDLRYRKFEQFPFKVKVYFDENDVVISSTIGYHQVKNRDKKYLPIKIPNEIK